jgi:hypothetical protein
LILVSHPAAVENEFLGSGIGRVIMIASMMGHPK